jgi:hypothetical protein
LLCALSLAGAPRLGAQAPREAGVPTATPLRGPATCAIDGRAAITGLEVVRRADSGHDTIGRIDLPPRDVRVEVLTPSRFLVSTRAGVPELTGHTGVRPPISLRRELVLGGVHVARGAPVTRTTPRERALDVDIDLGAGVLLRRVVLGCDALEVRAADAPDVAGAPSGREPLWHPRGRELAIRDRPEEGLEVARLRVPGTLVLVERARDAAFVRVHARLPSASLDGWVRDSALVPLPSLSHAR